MLNVLTVRPRVLHVEESYRVYCTLVIGVKRAILWDTGLGKQDLRPLAESHAPETLVLCSHGHYDHVGGIARFPAVYLSPEDCPMLDEGVPCKVLPLYPGQKFDLGGISAETVPLRGHTRGSLGLLIPEERLLLAGDALNTRLVISLRALGDLRETLLAALELPFETYLTSHAPTELTKKQIVAHLRHLRELRLENARPCRIAGSDGLFSDRRTPEGRSAFFILK